MEFSGSGRQLKKSKGSLATKMSSSSKVSVDDGDDDGKTKPELHFPLTNER
jgi:hypothetical protein